MIIRPFHTKACDMERCAIYNGDAGACSIFTGMMEIKDGMRELETIAKRLDLVQAALRARP